MSPSVCLFTSLGILYAGVALAQEPGPLNTFFEGKQVTVRMDMPGTQEGVDIYPQRPQPLDFNSYTKRIKKYGTALRNGDTVMITKVKVKDKGIEFQLGGGGYGTITDDTDTSPHFTSSDKSGREKDLEDQLSRETDPNKRRSLQRRLDDARADRERRNRRDQEAAQDAAESKKSRIDAKRLGGGSRFNIRYDSKLQASEITPQTIMAVLSQYVVFPPESFGGSGPGDRPGGTGTESLQAAPPAVGPSAPAPTGSAVSLTKGMTLAQVEALYGQPLSQEVRDQDGLKVTLCVFQGKDSTIKADFVNGVLVQYTVSSR